MQNLKTIFLCIALWFPLFFYNPLYSSLTPFKEYTETISQNLDKLFKQLKEKPLYLKTNQNETLDPDDFAFWAAFITFLPDPIKKIIFEYKNPTLKFTTLIETQEEKLLKNLPESFHFEKYISHNKEYKVLKLNLASEDLMIKCVFHANWGIDTQREKLMSDEFPKIIILKKENNSKLNNQEITFTLEYMKLNLTFKGDASLLYTSAYQPTEKEREENRKSAVKPFILLDRLLFRNFHSDCTRKIGQCEFCKRDGVINMPFICSPSKNFLQFTTIYQDEQPVLLSLIYDVNTEKSLFSIYPINKHTSTIDQQILNHSIKKVSGHLLDSGNGIIKIEGANKNGALVRKLITIPFTTWSKTDPTGEIAEKDRTFLLQYANT